MRFYSINVTGADGGAVSAFPAGAGGATWTSQVNGSNDPGALDIELDIVTGPQATPVGGSFLRIYGISLQQIAQAANLNKANVDITLGMAKGLPLANPAQQGLVAHATIFPAFGNWIGTAQTLDLILAPSFGTAKTPKNIVHNQPAGQTMQTALQSALSTAFPGFTPKISISPKLILPNDEIGFYGSLQQYGGYIRALSQKILGSTNYPGVMIAQSGKNIIVSDGTQPGGAVKQISFQDLIGQPTWYGFNTVSLKTVMRGDISVLDKVKLPQTVATVQAASAPQFRQGSGFQGTFQVQQVRHTGRFRQPTGEAWVTTFELAALNTGQG